MAPSRSTLIIDYDEANDVLYASLGAPQAALSHEVKEDILLRYVPPSMQVVGITIMNFLEHYPSAEHGDLSSFAHDLVRMLLEQYPEVPDEDPPVVSFTPAPWLYFTFGSGVGIVREDETRYIGYQWEMKSPEIQGRVTGERDRILCE